MPFTLREPLRTTLDLTLTQHVPLTLQWSVRYRCSKDANRIRPFPEQVQLLPSLGGQDPYQAFHLSLWVSESNNTLEPVCPERCARPESYVPTSVYDVVLGMRQALRARVCRTAVRDRPALGGRHKNVTLACPPGSIHTATTNRECSFYPRWTAGVFSLTLFNFFCDRQDTW